MSVFNTSLGKAGSVSWWVRTETMQWAQVEVQAAAQLQSKMN